MSGLGDGRADARRGELGALRWAIVQDPGDALAKFILVVMSVPANKSFECYMSHRKIAANASCDRRTVMRKVQRLLSMGYLEDISAEHPERPTKTYRFCVETD